MSVPNTLLAAALDYASRGRPVLPLHDVASGKCSCGNPNCGSAGKHPRTEHGWKDSTTDPERIREWWTQWPTANIGLSTEHLFVLDRDDRHGGHETLAQLVAEHGPLPHTPEVRTGSGSGHYYFKPPAGVVIGNSAGKLGPGLDVRARGGYVVAPPSLHASGEHYEWVVGLDEAVVAEAPAWLIELLQIPSEGEKEGPQQSVPLLPPTEHRRAMSALAAIPPETRDLWMRAGMAIKTALGEAGFVLWDAWSRMTSQGNYDGSTQRAQWNSFAPGEHSHQVSESSLWYLARQYGWIESEAKRPPGKPGDGAMTRCLADVETVEIEWIWYGRIARGKLTLISGDPGLGKTWMILDIVARITAGLRLPTGEIYGPATVVIVSAEDDAADTLRPRLEAAGADLGRVYTLDAVLENGRERSFTLKDLPQLEELLVCLGDVALVVIDPISAYMGHGVNAHHNTDVRAVLGPLAALAQKYRVGLVALSHLNKGAGGAALYRTSGSIAFVAAARVAMLVTESPDDPDERLLLPVKNNLAPSRELGWAYTITGEPPRVEWSGAELRCVDEILASLGLGLGDSKPQSKVDRAADLIRSTLAPGPKPATEMHALLEDAGFKEKTIERAREKAGVDARGGRSGWMWHLPSAEQAASDAGTLKPEAAGFPPASEERTPNPQERHDGGLSESQGAEHQREAAPKKRKRSKKASPPLQTPAEGAEAGSEEELGAATKRAPKPSRRAREQRTPSAQARQVGGLSCETSAPGEAPPQAPPEGVEGGPSERPSSSRCGKRGGLSSKRRKSPLSPAGGDGEANPPPVKERPPTDGLGGLADFPDDGGTQEVA